MRSFIICLVAAITAPGCNDARSLVPSDTGAGVLPSPHRSVFATNSWQYFLQHLPLKAGLVLDYNGDPVSNQSKAYVNVDYDIGDRDLQQCADALIRLRAEYLFAQQKYSDIKFHFTNGDLYTLEDYCAGRRPVIRGTALSYTNASPCDNTHASLRKYLDIVYSYAGTISLYEELKNADAYDIGTVIITPGSPGHCCIIIDDSTGANNKRFYMLAEGYTPAQSIYVLRNTNRSGVSPWYELQRGVITTGTYEFTSYKLGRFE